MAIGRIFGVRRSAYGKTGGIKACADASELTPGTLSPVPQLGSYPGPPGPFGGPNSRIDYADGKNNGTDLILYCQGQIS